MTEREAFEEAIAADRYDQATRLVYADWLNEHGFDSAAEAQRLWTRQWQESEDWLRAFAAKLGASYYDNDDWDEDCDTSDREITYADMMNAAAVWVETCKPYAYDDMTWWQGEFFTQLGSDSARDLMSNADTRASFWRHYQVVTRTEVPAEKQGTVFSCSC